MDKLCSYIKQDNQNNQDLQDKIEADFQHYHKYLEQLPIYPRCEGVDYNELKSCMTEKILKTFMKMLDTETLSQQLPSSTYKIYLSYKIDKTGELTVSRINIKSNTIELDDEQIQIIKNECNRIIALFAIKCF